jgi:hypothetical protein
VALEARADRGQRLAVGTVVQGVGACHRVHDHDAVVEMR